MPGIAQEGAKDDWSISVWKGRILMRDLLIALTSPLEGREEEFNAWYSNVHAKEMLEIDGVLSVQRFLITHGASSDAANRYVAIYEVAAGETGNVMARLAESAKAGRLTMSSAMSDRSETWALSALTERLERREDA
jgi:hypothetical protein